MRLFGYARVSTSQQSLDVQISELKALGIREDRILTDKATGANTDRDGLQTLLTKVEAGDKILITRMDRLGRDTQDMLSILQQLNEIGVTVTFVKEGITAGTSHGDMVLTILSAVAQAERARILERTQEGRLEAKAKGIKFVR